MTTKMQNVIDILNGLRVNGRLHRQFISRDLEGLLKRIFRSVNVFLSFKILIKNFGKFLFKAIKTAPKVAVQHPQLTCRDLKKFEIQ